MKFASLVTLILAAAPTFAASSPQGMLDALTQPQNYEARRVSSSAEDLDSNGDARTIMPGDTLVLLDADGPGILTHFWNTIAAFDPFAGRSVVLRIYYDNNEYPSVQAPLGDFFGVGHGVNQTFTSLPVSTSASGLARNCYWRMPFQKHVKVTVTNESDVYPVADFYYYLDWQKWDKLPKDTHYFHANYKQSMPATPGHYTILDTKGQGHYAGTVYSVQQVELGWFGEGDDFIYIDGAKEPQLRGTGTEDYFNDAWGFREFDTPFHGVSLYEGGFPGDRLTAYRWHIMDPIPFKESLRVTIEHRGSTFDENGTPDKVSLTSSSERPDWVSSVAFWYQNPPLEIKEALPPATERIAPYQILPVGELDVRADTPEGVTPSHVGVQYAFTTQNGWLEFDFDVKEDGRYQLSGIFQDAITGAIFQPILDGNPIGNPIDMEVPPGGFITHRLDLHDLKKGTHTLRFQKTDLKSPHTRSIPFTFTSFTIEYFLLLRLEDMEGYHQTYNARVKKD